MTTDKLKVTAHLLPDGQVFTVPGREAETLLALAEAGPHGITSLEAFEAGWAVRLAAYIHRLRTAYRLDIEAWREPHKGGNHARYRLRSTVAILARSDRPELATV